MGVMQVMRSLLMAQPHKESVTGTDGVASFNTDFKGLAKVVIPFTPIQDLHGMPNPYPPGGNVNLIPDGTNTENGYINGDFLGPDGTTHTSSGWMVSEYFEVDPSITYTWSNQVNTATTPSICFYDENKDFISGISFDGLYSKTFNPPENAVYARSSQSTYAYQASNPNGTAIQLEVGSTATASAAITANTWTTVATLVTGKRSAQVIIIDDIGNHRMKIDGASIQVYGTLAKDEQLTLYAVYLLA